MASQKTIIPATSSRTRRSERVAVGETSLTETPHRAANGEGTINEEGGTRNAASGSRLDGMVLRSSFFVHRSSFHVQASYSIPFCHLKSGILRGSDVVVCLCGFWTCSRPFS